MVSLSLAVIGGIGNSVVIGIISGAHHIGAPHHLISHGHSLGHGSPIRFFIETAAHGKPGGVEGQQPHIDRVFPFGGFVVGIHQILRQVLKPGHHNGLLVVELLVAFPDRAGILCAARGFRSQFHDGRHGCQIRVSGIHGEEILQILRRQGSLIAVVPFRAPQAVRGIGSRHIIQGVLRRDDLDADKRQRQLHFLVYHIQGGVRNVLQRVCPVLDVLRDPRHRFLGSVCGSSVPLDADRGLIGRRIFRNTSGRIRRGILLKAVQKIIQPGHFSQIKVAVEAACQQERNAQKHCK